MKGSTIDPPIFCCGCKSVLQIDNLDTETRAMVALLAKFRIEADDVIIISDATQKPSEASVRKFSALMEQVTAGEGESGGESAGEQARVTREELDTHREKTNFYLRMSEVTHVHGYPHYRV